MKDKVALVTGASSGIGLAITNTLLERGWTVVGVSRRGSPPRPGLVSIEGDVGVRDTAVRAVSRLDRLDLLVNNAGIFQAKTFTDYTEKDYAQLLATNLAGFFHFTQECLRVMAPAKRGHIVNIGTSLAAQPVAGVPSALPILIKGGIEAATRSLAIEYAPLGIRVNTIAAGIIDTPMHPPASHAALRALSPAQRLGTTTEIAEALLYLEGASFVSGEILHVDGGAHAGKWA